MEAEGSAPAVAADSGSAVASVALSSGVAVEFSDAAASPTLLKWAKALDSARLRRSRAA